MVKHRSYSIGFRLGLFWQQRWIPLWFAACGFRQRICCGMRKLDATHVAACYEVHRIARHLLDGHSMLIAIMAMCIIAMRRLGISRISAFSKEVKVV